MNTTYEPLKITGGLTKLGVFGALRKKCFECKPLIQSIQSWDGIRYPITSDCSDCHIANLSCVNPYMVKISDSAIIDCIIDYCNSCEHSNDLLQCNNPDCVLRLNIYDHAKQPKRLTVNKKKLKEGLTTDDINSVFKEQCKYCCEEGDCNGITATGPCPIHTRRNSKSMRLLVDAINKYCGNCESDNDDCMSESCPIRRGVWQ